MKRKYMNLFFLKTGTVIVTISIILPTMDVLADQNDNFHGETQNLIHNPSFIFADPFNPSVPFGWLMGNYGTNTADFIYPFIDASSSGPDISNDKAVSIQMSDYDSGDAKWYFRPVSVTPGRQYLFQDYYMSDVSSRLVIEYFNSDKDHLSYNGFFDLPATSPDTWTLGSATFRVPHDASYATVFHLIASNGTLSTEHASLTLINHSKKKVPPTASTTDPVTATTTTATSTDPTSTSTDPITDPALTVNSGGGEVDQQSTSIVNLHSLTQCYQQQQVQLSQPQQPPLPQQQLRL